MKMKMKMKWKLLGLMLFSIIALTYCTQEYLSDSAKETSEVMFSFSASVPEAATQTRAVNITRYIVEIYKTADQATLIERVEQAGNTIVVSLETNTNYTCLFWADEVAPNDNANGTFDATSLKNVTLNTGKTMAEAFFTRLDITSGTTFNVTLNRATAKVNMVATTAVAANTDLKVTYNEYKSFNTFSSDVVGAPVATSNTFNSAATEGILGTFLTFASVSGILTDFTALYNATMTNEMKNVPLKANYVTNIRGDFTAGSQDFTITITIDEVLESVVGGVHIDVGTVVTPKWIIIADRNALKGGTNGATAGNSSTVGDYGHYYQSSNATNDPTNVDKSYNACFDFAEGNGLWRQPTEGEWAKIVGNTGYTHAQNPDRKAKWDLNSSSEWRIFDERTGQTANFVTIPMAGYNSSGAGTAGDTNVGTSAYMRTSSHSSNGWYFARLRDNGETYTDYDTGTDGATVRCVRDI